MWVILKWYATSFFKKPQLPLTKVDTVGKCMNDYCKVESFFVTLLLAMFSTPSAKKSTSCTPEVW